MTAAVRFEVRKASPRLGAEIAGVELATWHYAVDDYDGPRPHRKVIAAQPAAPAAR